MKFFLSPSSIFDLTVEISVVWLETDKSVLFLKKSSLSKGNADKLASMGGKIETAENPIEAKIRAIKEEAVLKISRNQLPLMTKLYVYNFRD